MSDQKNIGHNSKKDFLKNPVEHIDITSFDAQKIISSMEKMSFVSRETANAANIYNEMLKDKVKYALKNNLKIVFCIVENKSEKKNNRTLAVLKKQLTNVLEKKFNKNNIIVAYEPIWSIGTGKIPGAEELKKTTVHIKKILKNIKPWH